MRPIWRDPRRNSAHKPAKNVQNGWLATRLVTRCDFGSLGVPGPASTPLGLNGYPFSGPKCQNRCTVVTFGASRNSQADPPDPAEMSHSQQNRPWVPHAVGQDDGSLHKLPQTIGSGTLMFCCSQWQNKKLRKKQNSKHSHSHSPMAGLGGPGGPWGAGPAGREFSVFFNFLLVPKMV